MSYLNTNSMKGGLASGVITLNKKNIIIAVNEQYLVMTGFNQSDLKGLPISKFDKLCAEQISFSKNNSNFGHFNSTLQDKNGKNYPVEVFFFSQITDEEEQTLLFFKEISLCQNFL